MGKVSIKKNVKPKKITTKKTVQPKKKVIKKNEKEMEKQTQTQSQTVNINLEDIITKKKRGRPVRKSITVKKPIQQPSINPIIQSYNQPIFKQPNQQPTSLASSILATQEKPKVVSEEVKEQTSLRKAIQEQNIDTEEPKVNELERVRSERVKKFSKPKDDITENTIKEMKKEEPIRHALLGQLLSDQQDDAEEISALTFQPATPEIPYTREAPLSESKGTQTGTFERKFRIGTDLASHLAFGEQLKQEHYEPMLETIKNKRNSQPVEETSFEIPTQTEPTNETPLDQPEERGAAELVSQTEPTDAQPLTRDTVELGFGGLTEEPVQTSVGQFLPPEPVSQNELVKKKNSRKPKTILQAVEPPPPITQPQETTPPITDQVRAADQYITERLVKDEPPGGAPFAQAEAVETKQKIPSEGEQIEEKWNELKDAGLIKTKRTKGGTRRPLQPDPDAPKNYNLLDEIRSISGYENWEYIKRPNKSGPKKKAAIAEAIEISDV